MSLTEEAKKELSERVLELDLLTLFCHYIFVTDFSSSVTGFQSRADVLCLVNLSLVHT